MKAPETWTQNGQVTAESHISKTQSQKNLFSIFPYFSLFFSTDVIQPSDRAAKFLAYLRIDREFRDLSENVSTSDRYPNSATKKIIFDFSIFFFIDF